jgi:hypothetical protein
MDAKEKYKQCSYSQGIKDMPSTLTEKDFHAPYLKKISQQIFQYSKSKKT